MFAGGRERLLLAGLLILGAALRIPGLFTDFWLDEVWSLRMALAIDSPLEVFTAIRTFNNHHLNSLLLYAIGDQRLGEPPWLIYRLPALAAGIGAVVLAGVLAGRRSALAGWLALLLTATSFPLVFYSSEARGYSLLVFFALLSFWLLLRYDETGRDRYRFAYWASSVLGLLSQLVYLFFLVGAMAWSYARHGRRAAEGEDGARPANLARLHDVPLIALLLLFFVDLRHSDFGGAISFSGADVFVTTLSMTIGGPPAGYLSLVACAAVLLVLVLELVRLHRDGSELWILFATAMVVFPLLLIVAARPRYMSPRYFLVGMALFQILLAGFLARCWQAGRAGRAAVVLGLVLVIGGSLKNLEEFWNLGRGGYGEAIRWIAERTPEASVGSGDDFGARLMVEFYTGIDPSAAGVHYVSREDRPTSGWDWWIERRLSSSAAAPPEVWDGAEARYVLSRSYPAFWLSGVTWHLYARREND